MRIRSHSFRSRDVPKLQPKQFHAFGRPLLVFRGENGKVTKTHHQFLFFLSSFPFVLFVFFSCSSHNSSSQVAVTDPYCPHLGANLSLGYVKNNCIECPFHVSKREYFFLFCADGLKEKWIVPVSVAHLFSFCGQGWKFDGETGKCVEIPSCRDSPIPQNAVIATWHVRKREEKQRDSSDRETENETDRELQVSMGQKWEEKGKERH